VGHEHHWQCDVDGEQRVIVCDDNVGVKSERYVWNVSGCRHCDTIETFAAYTVRHPERGGLAVQARVVERINVQTMLRVCDVRTTAA
jgi:hypothetical protein